jgi:hypothetical protein
MVLEERENSNFHSWNGERKAYPTHTQSLNLVSINSNKQRTHTDKNVDKQVEWVAMRWGFGVGGNLLRNVLTKTFRISPSRLRTNSLPSCCSVLIECEREENEENKT